MRLTLRISSCQLSDWYTIQRVDVQKHQGASVLSYYSSLREALQRLYPEYPWEPSRFFRASRASRNHWRDVNNQKEMLERVGKQLGVQQVRGIEYLCS